MGGYESQATVVSLSYLFFFFFLSSSCLSELCGLFDVRALAPQTYVWNVIHVLLIIANGTRRVITRHFKSKRKKQCIVSVTTTKSSKNIYCLDIYCDPRRRSKHIRFGIKFIQKKYWVRDREKEVGYGQQVRYHFHWSHCPWHSWSW